MARESYAYYVTAAARRLLSALAAMASGHNPDGTPAGIITAARQPHEALAEAATEAEEVRVSETLEFSGIGLFIYVSLPNGAEESGMLALCLDAVMGGEALQFVSTELFSASSSFINIETNEEVYGKWFFVDVINLFSKITPPAGLTVAVNLVPPSYRVRVQTQDAPVTYSVTVQEVR